LQNSDIEPRWFGWQVKWIAGMSMLRSIGYVLKKVDSKISEDRQAVISELWQDWTSQRETNAIFWDFIDLERHNILKEFALGFTHEPYLEPDEYEVEDIVYDKIAQYREAVYWWRFQLRSAEDMISKRTKNALESRNRGR